MNRLLFLFLLCFSLPGFASLNIIDRAKGLLNSVFKGTTASHTKITTENGNAVSEFYTVTEPEERRLIELYNQALAAKKAGNWKEAISLMTQVTEIKFQLPTYTHDPRRRLEISGIYRKANYELGLMHKERGNPAEAERYFKTAYQQHASGRAAYELAMIYKKNREWRNAEGLFKAAMIFGYRAQNPAIYELAKMYKEIGKRDQAVKRFHELSNIKGDRNEAEFFRRGAEFFLAKIQAEDGDVEAQITLSSLYFIRGLEYENRGEICPYFEGEDYRKEELYWIIKAAEKSIDAKHSVALTYYHRGDIDEAIKWMKRVITEGPHPDSREEDNFKITLAHFDLALIYKERENSAEAIYWMTKAAERNFILAQERLAEMHAKKGDLTKAIHWMTRAALNKSHRPITPFNREEDNLSIPHKLALLHKANGDKKQAIHWMKKATKKGTEPAVLAKIELAKMYEEDGNKQKAIQTLEEAMKFHCPIKGYHLLAKYELALLLEKEGDRKQAVEYMIQVENSNRFFLLDHDSSYSLAARRQLVRMHSEQREEVQTAYWQERTEPYTDLSVDTNPVARLTMKFLPEDLCHLAMTGGGD